MENNIANSDNQTYCVFTMTDLHDAIKTICYIAGQANLVPVYGSNGAVKPRTVRYHCQIAIAALYGMVDDVRKVESGK